MNQPSTHSKGRNAKPVVPYTGAAQGGACYNGHIPAHESGNLRTYAILDQYEAPSRDTVIL